MFAGINRFQFTGGPCAELVALGRTRADASDRSSWITADVILPTGQRLGSVVATDLLPGAYRWDPERFTGRTG